MDKTIFLYRLISELKEINEIKLEILNQRGYYYCFSQIQTTSRPKANVAFWIAWGDINDIEKENYASPVDEEDYNEI